MTRDYYNRRAGNGQQAPRLTLAEAADQIAAAYGFVDRQGCLQRSFGYRCVDRSAPMAGTHGAGLPAAFYVSTGMKVDYGLEHALRDAEADEVLLFTSVEFVHDHVAKPATNAGREHVYQDCGWHYDSARDTFNETAARAEWRTKVNSILKFYDDGYRLSDAGEVVRLVPDGMSTLVATPLPTVVAEADRGKIASAVRTFHLGRSTRLQRKQAVRDLADVLEFHRDDAQRVLSKKDDALLFQIANQFAVRHHNFAQKDDYSDAWLTWIFYVYLATAHLMLDAAIPAARPWRDT